MICAPHAIALYAVGSSSCTLRCAPSWVSGLPPRVSWSAISFWICSINSASSNPGRGFMPFALRRFSEFCRFHSRCFTAHSAQRVWPLYGCLAAAAQTLFLAFTSGGWFWCVGGFLLALLSWIPVSGGFRPFDCLLPARQAGALGYKYGVNQNCGLVGFIPVMLERSGGKIINLSGAGATNAWSNMSAYCSSKAAVVRLTEGWPRNWMARESR